jgi:hypothetical protein
LQHRWSATSSKLLCVLATKARTSLVWPAAEYHALDDYSILLTYGSIMAVLHLSLLYFVMPKLLPHFIPKITAMKPANRFHFTNEVACIAHHMLVIPPSLYAIYLQAITPLGETPDLSFMIKAASLTCGYFAADLLVCIPYFLKGQYLDFLVHHGLGILLVKMAVTNTFGARWVAWFLISELTTVIFTYCKYLMKTVRLRAASDASSAASLTTLLHAEPRALHSLFRRCRLVRPPLLRPPRCAVAHCVLLLGLWAG